MWSILLQALMLALEKFEQYVIKEREREEHEQRLATIKDDPRAAFRAKFGRVRSDVSTATKEVLPKSDT